MIFRNKFSIKRILPFKNRNSEHHNRIVCIWVRRSTKFQLKPTISIFQIKLARKWYFQFKTDATNTTIFFIGVFFHYHSRITGLQEKGEGIYLTPHYHFHLLHRHFDISWTITAESSPLHIGSSQTRTGNLWFPSTWTPLLNSAYSN